MPLLTPVKADFGETGNTDLDKFVFENLTALINAYDNLHRTKLPEWRRITKGTPRDTVRNFPWPNASNVVIQLVGENVDVIKAAVLGTIYEILPLWVSGLVGEWTDDEKGEEQRAALESFLDLMGMSRDELDLYRIESKAAHDIAALGSVVIKLPWVNVVEQVVIGLDSTSKSGFTESEEEMYDGPRPEKLAYEDWGATPTAQTWESAKFKYHEIRLDKQECEYKVFKELFSKEAWEKIKTSPDIEGLTEEEEDKIREQNLQSSSPNKELARWRFYECWFKYTVEGKVYNIIYTIHLQSKNRMNAFFNFYPKNEEPFEFGRLGFSEDGLVGYGFAEMGEMYQEEVSTSHNQRVDNRTLANTSVLFGGNNPRIDSGVSLFPMAVLPFNKDEVSIEQLGVVAPDSANDEMLTISLAKARFGTDVLGGEGMGSGTVNKKGGYSSMGTFSIMQQGNRRININVTDFRYLHLNLGQKFAHQYAHFGVGEKRLKYFGHQAANLAKAMSSIKEGRLNLPIKAATASINKEIEKQTGMLFTQVMQRHYGGIAQILQGVTNPSIPQELKDYLTGSIAGMSIIMSKLLRAFGYDDIYRLQPEMELIKKLKAAQQQGANNGQQPVQNTQRPATPSNGRSDIQETEGTQDNNSQPPTASSSNNGGGILIG
jgi:hypothetical protein